MGLLQEEAVGFLNRDGRGTEQQRCFSPLLDLTKVLSCEMAVGIAKHILTARDILCQNLQTCFFTLQVLKSSVEFHTVILTAERRRDDERGQLEYLFDFPFPSPPSTLAKNPPFSLGREMV